MDYKKYLKIFISALLILFSADLYAQKKKGNIQIGVVKSEGVAVYQDASFDAPVMGYLRAGKKFRISRKKYSGFGGIGSFYKIKVQAGVGYIADTDVIPEYDNIDSNNKSKKNKAFSKVEEKEVEKPPIFVSRYAGLSFGTIEYTEAIGGKEFGTNTTFFGVKLTGPGAVMQDLPLDLEVLFSAAVPSYYEEFVTEEPAGIIMIANASLGFPIITTNNFLLFYDLGISLNYSSLSFTDDSDVSYDSQEARIGLVGTFGGALRLGSILLKAESKYFYEKYQYPGIMAAIQFNY